MNLFDVPERTMPTYTFTVTDEDGNATQPTALSVSLFDRATSAIINSRDEQDILGANNVVVTNGVVVWSMVEADHPRVAAGDEGEIHVAEFEWTTATSKTGRHRVAFRVVDYMTVEV